MKLFIASDIHGSARFCGELQNRVEEEKPDQIVLLGDLLYHGPRNDLPEGYAPKEVIAMLSAYQDRILAVRGNCEAEVDQMVLPFPCMSDYAWLQAGGLSIYATHGHLWNPEHLPPLRPGTVFLFGHTHRKLARWVGEVLALNPGSVSIPKDSGRSYMVYQNGFFQWKRLDGTVLHDLAVSERSALPWED